MLQPGLPVSDECRMRRDAASPGDLRAGVGETALERRARMAIQVGSQKCCSSNHREPDPCFRSTHEAVGGRPARGSLPGRQGHHRIPRDAKGLQPSLEGRPSHPHLGFCMLAVKQGARGA